MRTGPAQHPRRPAAAPAPSPEAVIAGWPADRPLAAWGVGPASAWSRWAVLAEPTGARRARTRADLDDLLMTVLDRPTRAPQADDLPFNGGWIGAIGYHAGRLLEPKAGSVDPPCADRGWPAACFLRCERGWCYDKLLGEWRPFGSAEPLPPLDAPLPPAAADFPTPGADARGGYIAAVQRAQEYIRAGDIYQANIAHRLSGSFQGRAAGLLLGLLRARPWYGALLVDTEAGVRRAVASASPELFFRYDAATRTLTTRPMKGTRPQGQSEDLRESEKDRAELAMIVDLMRNDLGRVCEFRSIRVDQPRTIELHGPVLQAVSSVSGRLRSDLPLSSAVRALFPGGSITGAPKIRAMQIIEELEGVCRGPYCGAIGIVSDAGDACFSMAIRTVALSGRPGKAADELLDSTADYWAGAGIVADSHPEAEWEETLVKTAPLAAATAAARSGA